MLHPKHHEEDTMLRPDAAVSLEISPLDSYHNYNMIGRKN